MGRVMEVVCEFCVWSVMICFFFFFFQAEDGIRDHCVTGVQTCALPICCGPDRAAIGVGFSRPEAIRKMRLIFQEVH